MPTEDTQEKRKLPRQDPYRNAYKVLLEDLSINHKGLAAQLRRYLHQKDHERFKEL